MRLTTVILIASLVQVSAATFGQRITLSQKNTPLKTVLRELTRQSGYDFVYNGKLVGADQKVTVSLSNAELEEALKTVLTGLKLTYRIDGKIVSIKRAEEPNLIEKVVARFQSIDVRGRVLDENNQPLPGATISVKGKDGQDVTSDEKGNFYLQNMDENALLVVSFIGYKKKEVAAKEDVGILVLEMEDNSLEQVQVIAYGKMEKKFLTSDIGVVKAEEIQRQPVSNPILALAGRVPGLFIRQQTGVSSGPVNITIQGSNSLQNSNDPLYVVDGVPYTSQFTQESLGNLAATGTAGNPLSFINPADIESISILKDADATAIYGSRAANGAILITTKKGVAGKTNIGFNLQNGWSKVTRKLDLVNTQEYLDLRKEGYVNDGLPVPTKATTPARSNYDLTYWDQNKYTDVQDAFIGGTAKFTDLQGSISGGTAYTQFLASYGYRNETTVYPANFYDRKGNVHFNISHKSQDDRFRFMIGGSYLQAQNTLGNQDIANLVTRFAPNIPDLHQPDGSLNFEYLPNNITSTLNNPLVATIEKYTGKNSNLIADNSISYEVIKGLELKTTLGYNKLEADETLLRPISFFAPILATKTRTATYLKKYIATWVAEPQLTYRKQTPFGHFDFLLGSTFQQSKTNLQKQSGSGFATDEQLPDITAATARTIDLVGYELYRYSAVFGRLNYRLRDKYILNFNLRRDGSSRFGPESRFNTFFAVGGAWLFAEEAFAKRALPWLSYGKLRASYGTTGNDQIGNYRYLSLLSIQPEIQMLYQNGLSLQISRLVNPHLQWEETRKLNFGVDFGLLENKIMVNLTYARNRSSSQLITNMLPSITGAAGIDANLPALVENTSYEAQITVVPVKTSQFNWNLSGNITVPKNKLVSFPDFESSGYENVYIVGKPLTIIRAYDFAGVNPETGFYQFRTAKGELTSDPSYIDDRTRTIDINPKFYGGLVNTISFKGFQLDFLLQFVKQQATNYKFGNFPGAINSVPLRNVLDRWRKPGDVTDIQKVGLSAETVTAFAAAQASTGGYGDASYIRLKNASLSYSLPNHLISKAKLSSARIYVQGQNLLTFTKFYGGDPETPFVALQPLKTLTIGVQANF